MEIDSILTQVKERKHKSVLIQLPEGMLDQPLQYLLKKFSELEISVYVSGEPSYGVCDLAISLANTLGVDLLLHFGHSNFGFEKILRKFTDSSLDIMVIPAYYSPVAALDYTKLVKLLLEHKWKNIALSSTIQHQRTLEDLAKYLQKKNFHVYIKNHGQILGCHVKNLIGNNSDFEGIVSIHAGFFHTHGILLNIDKPLIQFNPYSQEILLYGEESRKKALQRRFGVISNAKKAKIWGILGSSKVGQYNDQIIAKTKEILQSKDHQYITVISENINPMNISNFNWVDSWVVSACPRLAIDDTARFMKPILTFNEFKYIFEKISWEELLEKGFF
jgi:2-(3-amino-3-carboxypropyl)histidine synthase